MYLTPSPPPKTGVSPQPFGRLIRPLKASGILSPKLAEELLKFNALINVPSKHFGAYVPTRWLDERTFSVLEVSSALVIMRRLSIQLFAILNMNGVVLPSAWPELKDEWLSWSRLFDPCSR